MKNIAIIPARSGSKGLPDKNIRLLNGKPLMAYTIEAAISSHCFDKVFVSTDAERYAEIAREYGAEVPFLREPALAGDTTSTWAVVRQVLKEFSERGEEFDTFTILQPTSPLRTERNIQEAFHILDDKQATSVVSVCEAEHSPLKYNTISSSGSMEHFSDRRADRPRQMIEKYYLINGALYIVKIHNKTEFPKDIYSEHCYAYVMERRESIDIDNEEDLELAGYLLSRQK